MSKIIRNQLATVQRLIDDLLHSGPIRLDDYRTLAALAETQAHLVRAISDSTIATHIKADAPDRLPEASWWADLFSTVNGQRVVDWSLKDWECPACGGRNFMVASAPPSDVLRPHATEKKWILADPLATCHDCRLGCSVETAARSWHLERAGFDPMPTIARHRNGLT